MTIWITPQAPWHECLTSALPHLMQPADRSWILAPELIPGAVKSLGVDRCMVLGPHLMSARERADLPLGAAVYETENRFSLPLLDIFDARPDLRWHTWSRTQAKAMRAEYLPLRPIRYEGPARKAAAVALHYGSLNTRRACLLHAAAARGATVRIAPPGTFGADLDAQINAAAVVLNVHYYDQPAIPGRCGLLETFRIIPALARGALVVSETSCDEQTELELLAAFPGQFFTAPYGRLAEAVADVLRSIEEPEARA